MNRMSLSNLVRDISYTQFLDLTMEFARTCADLCLDDLAQGISVQMSIRGRPPTDKEYPLKEVTTVEDFRSLSPLLESEWKDAVHAIVTVTGLNSPGEILGQIEFKGENHKRVLYSLPPGDDATDVLKTIDRSHPLMIRGNGYGAHEI